MNLSYEKIVNHPSFKKLLQNHPSYSEKVPFVELDASRSLRALTSKEDLVKMYHDPDQRGNQRLVLRAMKRSPNKE